MRPLLFWILLLTASCALADECRKELTPKPDDLRAADGGASSNKVIEYGNIKFVVPPLQHTGFILRPSTSAEPVASGILASPEVRAINHVWDFNRLLEKHQPIRVGSVENPADFAREGMISVLDMPIKFPGTDCFVPDNFAQLDSTLQKMIDVEIQANPDYLRKYFAYLTVHQSWVEAGDSQRRPGLHVDGFQGVERPVKEEIEHSYIVSNAVPTVFTRQAFQITNFDFARYNIFSELDRQSDPSQEFISDADQIYLANAYVVHRADVARKRVLRTFVRLTFSVAIFDRLGLTDNPLFPYQWERKAKTLQGTLEKYTPPIAMEQIPVLDSLGRIPGKKIGVIGIGEGSDGLQAAQIASLLSGSGKEIEFVASFRTARDFLGGSEISKDVVRVTPDFRMQGRNFETPLGQDFPTYVVFDRENPAELKAHFGTLVDHHPVDGIVFVDGGGNVLAPLELQKKNLNDHRTLLAAEHLPVKKTLVIVSPGVDMPPDAHQLLVDVNARRFRPSEAQRELILDNFKRWGMPYENPHTFAFIPMIWQQALRGDFGPQRFPTQYPGDPRYVVTPEGQDLMVVDYAKVVRGIR